MKNAGGYGIPPATNTPPMEALHTVSNISSDHPCAQQFLEHYRRTAGSAADCPTYYAIGRSALELPSAHWYLYSLVAVLANFGTRIADLKHRSRVLRAWRCRRQITRVFSDLVRRGFLVRQGPGQYSLYGRVQRAQAARLRPVRSIVLSRCHPGETALYTRFLVTLAWTRTPWRFWTWQRVRSTLRISTEQAQQLFAAFRALQQVTTRRLLRLGVFWSRRPQWYLYTLGDRVIYDPRPSARGTIRRSARDGPGANARSANVSLPDRVCSIMGCVVTQCLTSTPHRRRDWGGRGRDTRAAQRTWDIARAAYARAHGGRRPPDREQGIGSGPPASGEVNAHLASGRVFEALLAGLPPRIRAAMEHEKAVRDYRLRNRLTT